MGTEVVTDFEKRCKVNYFFLETLKIMSIDTKHSTHSLKHPLFAPHDPYHLLPR